MSDLTDRLAELSMNRRADRAIENSPHLPDHLALPCEACRTAGIELLDLLPEIIPLLLRADRIEAAARNMPVSINGVCYLCDRHHPEHDTDCPVGVFAALLTPEQQEARASSTQPGKESE